MRKRERERERERERDAEGGSSERKETKPVRVNNPVKLVIKGELVRKTERLAADHKDRTEILSLSGYFPPIHRSPSAVQTEQRVNSRITWGYLRTQEGLYFTVGRKWQGAHVCEKVGRKFMEIRASRTDPER